MCERKWDSWVGGAGERVGNADMGLLCKTMGCVCGCVFVGCVCVSLGLASRRVCVCVRRWEEVDSGRAVAGARAPSVSVSQSVSHHPARLSARLSVCLSVRSQPPVNTMCRPATAR